jgi:hypothetical protein
MNRTTLAIFEDLKKANWFSQVGVRDAAAAIVLSSWQEAIAHCSSAEWEDLTLDMANYYSGQVAEQSKERYLEWNDVVDDLKKILIPFVRGKIERVVRANKLPKIFEDTVQWDVLFICMETEYADVCPPGFYGKLAFWYLKGHFPCGWRGVFPQGMQIVY